MSGTTFDVHVRSLECPRCGAPVKGAIDGGLVPCAYCGAEVEIAVRARAERAGTARSLGDEVARLSRLRAQLENPVEGHAYDLRRAGVDARDVSLRDAWTRAKTHPPATPEAGRLLCWMALQLAKAEREAGRPAYARAALETALDRLPDDGHRHLVRCQLAIEAAREGDVLSAEGWLAECDEAPELLELDGPYREAKARVLLARGDAAGVLTVLGAREGDVPFHPSLGTARIAVRLEALERLGRDADADAELAAAIATYGEDDVLATLATKRYAPRARLRFFAAKRGGLLRGFFAAVAGPLFAVPVFALVLTVGALIPRCTFDADVFLGTQGHLLCPSKCAGCRGPLHIVTEWSPDGDGGYGTNGPRYFCPSKKNGVDGMTSRVLAARAHELGPYELFYSPQAVTFLFFLGLGLPWAARRGFVRHARAEERRRALDEEIGALVAETGVPAPPDEPAPPRFGPAALFFLASVALAGLVIAADLLL
jgi:hypothetical protein